MKPMYVPKGKAKEYGDYAVNIYTGCPHRCYYCFAPNVLHRDRETFHTKVEPRPGIVDALKKQLEREVIKAIKDSGNHVQILTKGDGSRDFDLLDGNDWYGITYDGMPHGVYEPSDRVIVLADAKYAGLKTWVSCEPVVYAGAVLEFIENCHDIIDKVKIGKLNYHPSAIDWKQFGHEAEQLCRELGLDYYIKESLRKEMEG